MTTKVCIWQKNVLYHLERGRSSAEACRLSNTRQDVFNRTYKNDEAFRAKVDEATAAVKD